MDLSQALNIIESVGEPIDDDQRAFSIIGEIEGCLNSEQLDRLESELRLRVGALGWTGDPLKQPPVTVLAAIRTVIRDSLA